ncbi:hypothetical protein CBR_g3878 [Chara braunii]|uniref:Chitin-binding type-2 domain-containing protein n=1 Tax=Chara braunii TaxID=69332 RepID=A0A388KGN5_CHABU|nr:hypothetical protein CBR_g3878 [Chara braunii]|eukprot:GBG69178.1 hypothetical protein CBR_g3878 [Chara braunii]
MTMKKTQRVYRRVESTHLFRGAMRQHAERALSGGYKTGDKGNGGAERRKEKGAVDPEELLRGVREQREKEHVNQHTQSHLTPGLSWADKVKQTPAKNLISVSITRTPDGAKRAEEWKIPLDNISSARAFFLSHLLTRSEQKVHNQGGQTTVIRALPVAKVQEIQELYLKHASNWVFYDDVAYKTTNDKILWIRKQLACLDGGWECAQDAFLIQPVSSTIFTILSMHKADKRQMDRWRSIRCDRSEVGIYPWSPLRKQKPEEKRDKMMADHFWVEFRHIPIEVQAAFVQEFGEKYEIVDFIDPLPPHVGKRDDYLMLALHLPEGQPFSIDDVIPYRIGDKEICHTPRKETYGSVGRGEVGSGVKQARRSAPTGFSSQLAREFPAMAVIIMMKRLAPICLVAMAFFQLTGMASAACCRGDGYFADKETGCRSYCFCAGGSEYKLDCPEGLLFNEALGLCDWPANVKGLFFKEELGCGVGSPGHTSPNCLYCQASNEYPCIAGQAYYGRGPIQLSYNYNYGLMGKQLGLDLLHNPELVLRDAATAFRTALDFWMTPQPPKPSCHDVMAGKWTPTAADVAGGRLPGFGVTTLIINGGVECGQGSVTAQEKDRLGYYDHHSSIMGVDKGANTDCSKMGPFGSNLGSEQAVLRTIVE